MKAINAIKNFGKLMYDSARGLNATIWGGAENAEKVGKITTTGLSASDTLIGIDLALKDCAKGDYICTTFDIVGSISSATGLILGNIPSTRLAL